MLASRIHDFRSWLDDPQVRAAGIVAEAAPDGLNPVPWVTIPGALVPAPGDPRLHWPGIGEQDTDILSDMLGMSEEEIARLRADGVLAPQREGSLK